MHTQIQLCVCACVWFVTLCSFALRLRVRVFVCLCAHKCASPPPCEPVRTSLALCDCVSTFCLCDCVSVFSFRYGGPCSNGAIVCPCSLCVIVCPCTLCVTVSAFALCASLHTCDHLPQNHFPCLCVRVLACCHPYLCNCVLCVVYIYLTPSLPFPFQCLKSIDSFHFLGGNPGFLGTARCTPAQHACLSMLPGPLVCLCVVCCVHILNPFPSLSYVSNPIPSIFGGEIPAFWGPPVHPSSPCVS